MKGRAAGGGGAKTRAVAYGLTGALFLFGWVVLGLMLLMNEIFGGVEISEPVSHEQQPAG